MGKQEMAAGRTTGDRNSNFPVGMRVLAVDDDPTCLMLLDTLLRRCQYHVTTTSQAVMALKMLQENKNMFDLVISDVHMPDMDGFKLLELVGLEMDVPVIMLSAYGDKEHVMKGITHGACDYLLKPVRIEELKNIWQHVIRRKKIDTNNQKTSDKPHGDSVEAVEGPMGIGDSDHIGKIPRKRKDQNGDEYDEHDQEGNNNEDLAAPKKPRLVWTPNLHRKFVEAVNVLGIDKAFPKRILEMMNEESLTREKVASHLQKFRGYLKKISAAPSQEVNMVSVLGRTDSDSLGHSLNGFGDLYNLEVSRPIQNASFRSFSPGSVLGRLNSPGLGMLGLSSSGAIQLDHAQNSTSPITDMANFQSLMIPENQNGNILQGLPLPLGALSGSPNDSKIYPISNVFSNGRRDVGSSSNSLLATENNPMPVQKQFHSTQMGGVFENQSSVLANSLSSECPQSLDVGGFNDNWLNAVQSSQIYLNFQQTTLNNMRDFSPMAMHIRTNPHAQVADVRTNLHCLAAMISGNGRQSLNFKPTKEWDDHEDYTSHLSNLMYSSMASSIDAGPMDQRFDSGNVIYPESSCKLVGQSNCHNLMPMQYNEVEQSPAQKAAELSYGNLKEQRKLQGSYDYSKVDSLEDLVNAMRNEEQSKLDLKEGDFGCDAYSLSVGT